MNTTHKNTPNLSPSGSPRSRSGFVAALSLAASLIGAGLALTPTAVQAVPSFARQMNLQCIACHTSFPMLNQFGRTFKLTGYTDSAGVSKLPPVAVMLMPSYTHTAQPQDGGAAPGFGDNNNYALTQASIFYSGRLFGPYADTVFGPKVGAILNKIGIFSQVTYDGVGKAWSWDNIDVRYATTTSVGDSDVILGAYWNNNPTLQDPWNSTPAFGYPFSGSGLAPGPAASTMIEGWFGQQVGGVGAYTMINDTWYFDVGGYQNLSVGFQKSMGVDPAGETQISGTAPYWRIAYQTPVDGGMFELGTFGMAAQTYPGRDNSAGVDSTTDVGFDSQYQHHSDHGDLDLMASWIHEQNNWRASQTLGNTSNASDQLNSVKLTAGYLYDKTYGLTTQYFAINGSTDEALYADSPIGSPKSTGFIVEMDYLPLNKGGGPNAWSRSNVKLSLQYVAYNRFDGQSGTAAANNNTTYLEAWVAF